MSVHLQNHPLIQNREDPVGPHDNHVQQVFLPMVKMYEMMRMRHESKLKQDDLFLLNLDNER